MKLTGRLSFNMKFREWWELSSMQSPSPTCMESALFVCCCRRLIYATHCSSNFVTSRIFGIRYDFTDCKTYFIIAEGSNRRKTPAGTSIDERTVPWKLSFIKNYSTSLPKRTYPRRCAYARYPCIIPSLADRSNRPCAYVVDRSLQTETLRATQVAEP